MMMILNTEHIRICDVFRQCKTIMTEFDFDFDCRYSNVKFYAKKAIFRIFTIDLKLEMRFFRNLKLENR
jgi:hypothetical protein